MFKRCVDLTLATLLLVLAIPVLLFCAVAIKLDSKGSVLFRQERMGRRFCAFKLLKLRTMEAASDGSLYTLGADPRITGAGRWLRRFKVDELPQLWNVFRGDMSMVGPRPVIPELAEEFRTAYQRLLDVRPGLTDPATLKYRHETEILALVPDPLRYFKTVVTPDKLRLSQAYLDRASAWTDLGLMMKTAFALVAPAPKPRLAASSVVATGKNRDLTQFPKQLHRKVNQPAMESEALVERMAFAREATGIYGP